MERFLSNEASLPGQDPQDKNVPNTLITDLCHCKSKHELSTIWLAYMRNASDMKMAQIRFAGSSPEKGAEENGK